MDESLTAMRNAWTGEPFEFEGRSVRVAPKPLTPGGPGMLMGGNSVAAARRAARFDMGLLAQGLNPEIEAIYRSECEKLGKQPGLCINPPPQTVTSAFVAEDVDRAWSEFGPHLLHDAQAYARWMTRGTALTTTVAAIGRRAARTTGCVPDLQRRRSRRLRAAERPLPQPPPLWRPAAGARLAEPRAARERGAAARTRMNTVRPSTR